MGIIEDGICNHRFPPITCVFRHICLIFLHFLPYQTHKNSQKKKNRMLPHNVQGGGAIQMFFIVFANWDPLLSGFSTSKRLIWLPPPPQVSWNTTHFSKDFFSFFWQKLRPMSKDFLWITNPFARRIIP